MPLAFADRMRLKICNGKWSRREGQGPVGKAGVPPTNRPVLRIGLSVFLKLGLSSGDCSDCKSTRRHDAQDVARNAAMWAQHRERIEAASVDDP